MRLVRNSNAGTTTLAVASLVFAISFPATGAIVVKNGFEWHQPADFTNLSWNEIETVCQESAFFQCAGSLKGVDPTRRSRNQKGLIGYRSG